MTNPGADNLISAVAKALNRELKIKNFSDRLMIQKGCFLLNDMGVSPVYNFSLYIRGPYSSELADDYYELMRNNTLSYHTDVNDSYISQLSEIAARGPKYLEAYSTLILAKRYNPKMEKDGLVNFVSEIKPTLKKEIVEAAGSLTFQ
ncbi:MAG: hypothetical protein FWF07_00965 [Methanomassiliicoccaceae archaeon]|nr:hypothetical protein [Methanomassiliicoccaceae archaeon]